jgi:alpha-galactosidase
MGGRHSNGTLFESPSKFPNGVKALAEWLHARGLKLGVSSAPSFRGHCH